MKTLHDQWFSTGLIDFEYKKYVLLDYLQYIESNFGRKRLFPFLADLINHYEQVQATLQGKQALANLFPKSLNAVDLEQAVLKYESLYQDPEALAELEQILAFASEAMKDEIMKGKTIYDEIESEMVLEPLGIMPLNQQAGFLLIGSERSKEVLAYRYEVSIFTDARNKYRGINTRFIKAFNTSIVNTPNNIKLQLIQIEKDLPNPATYLSVFKNWYALDHTLLPLAKRNLVRYIAGQGR